MAFTPRHPWNLDSLNTNMEMGRPAAASASKVFSTAGRRSLQGLVGRFPGNLCPCGLQKRSLPFISHFLTILINEKGKLQWICFALHGISVLACPSPLSKRKTRNLHRHSPSWVEPSFFLQLEVPVTGIQICRSNSDSVTLCFWRCNLYFLLSSQDFKHSSLIYF